MQAKMNSLFTDEEMGAVVQPPKETGLKIKKGKTNNLSKKQKQFNSLTVRIENLQKKIIDEEKKLNNLLNVYSKKIPDLEKKFAEKQIVFAKLIAKSSESINYGKLQIETLKDFVIHLCEQAFYVIEPDDDMKAFYDAWSEIGLDEELEMEKERMVEDLNDAIFWETGMDIDMGEFIDEGMSEEEINRKMQELLEQMMGSFEQEEQQPRKKRKKAKKQIEREEKQKLEEQQKLKSIRSIYLSLAKVLHPDKEMDDEQKADKEELMKKVTIAYKNNDLPSLLKLEQEWVAAENHKLDTLSDEKLQLYISSLKEQVNDLETELRHLYYHPRYELLDNYALHSEEYAVKQIRHLETQKEHSVEDLERSIELCSVPKPRKAIVEHLNMFKEMQKMKEQFLNSYDLLC